MKMLLRVSLAIALAGCATNAGWHWEKQGASSSEFNMDTGQCRAQALSGTGGNLNVGTVMIMESCLEGKGWVRVGNQ